MKKIIALAVLLALTLPVAAQKKWVGPITGITYKGHYPYWLYAVKEQTQKNEAKRFIKLAFFGLGTRKQIVNLESNHLEEDIYNEVKNKHNERFDDFKAQVASHRHGDYIIHNRSYLQSAIKNNEIFKDYKIYAYNVEYFSPFRLSLSQLTYLNAFFSAPTAQKKRQERLTPKQADLRENGVILYGFAEEVYLIINPQFKTIDLCIGRDNLKKFEELKSSVVENLLAE